MKFKLLLLFMVSQIWPKFEIKAQQKADNMNKETMNQWIVNDLITKWEFNKTFMLGVLEAMPESEYDFSPTPEMMSFREQAAHIGQGFNFHLKATGSTNLPKIDDKSKETILKSFDEIFDSIISYLKRYDSSSLANEKFMWYGKSTKNRIMNLMDNHLAHHRGQMVVYLRLKGAKPPAYVGW